MTEKEKISHMNEFLRLQEEKLSSEDLLALEQK